MQCSKLSSFNFTASHGHFVRQRQLHACTKVQTMVSKELLDVSHFSDYSRGFGMSGITFIKMNKTITVQKEIALMCRPAYALSDGDVQDLYEFASKTHGRSKFSIHPHKTYISLMAFGQPWATFRALEMPFR